MGWEPKHHWLAQLGGTPLDTMCPTENETEKVHTEFTI